MTSRPNDAPALFHVGYPKTASTYLQHSVFGNPDFGLGIPGGAVSRGYLMTWFRTADPYLFDPAAVAADMAELEAPLRADGLRPVWSDETLLGNPLTRTYDGAWVLDRLRRLGRPLKIVITIRNQHDLILSAYREYLKLNRHSLTDFIGTGDEPRSYRPILHPEYLCYDIAVDHWGKAFGAENILVLPQEMLRTGADAFVTRLAAFLGQEDVPAPPRQSFNVGLGGAALRLARPLNALYLRSPLSQRRSLTERGVKKTLRLVDRLSPAALDRALEARWKDQIATRFDGVYAASNQRLAQQTGLDLAALGYPL